MSKSSERNCEMRWLLSGFPIEVIRDAEFRIHVRNYAMFIEHRHAYRQDKIEAIIKLATDFGVLDIIKDKYLEASE